MEEVTEVHRSEDELTKKYTVYRKGKTVMGIRITGISTPIVGVDWEYTNKKEHKSMLPIMSDRKIQVFISSICGDNGKYDKARARLRNQVPDTIKFL